MQIIHRALLDELTRAARLSARQRKNHNFHEDYREPCQRLLNAVEPGSYIRPHRHLDPPKPETFIVLRGKMAAFMFSVTGAIEQVLVLTPANGAIGIDVPPGVWHSIISMECGSIFFETKPGPYEPLSDKDWAPWAPAEGSSEADAYLAMLEQRARSAGLEIEDS